MGEFIAYWNRLFKYNQNNQAWTYDRGSTTQLEVLKPKTSNYIINDGYTYTLFIKIVRMCKADMEKVVTIIINVIEIVSCKML